MSLRYESSSYCSDDAGNLSHFLEWFLDGLNGVVEAAWDDFSMSDQFLHILPNEGVIDVLVFLRVIFMDFVIPYLFLSVDLSYNFLECSVQNSHE